MHAHIISGGTPGARSDFIHKQTTDRTELIHLATEKSSITIKQIQDLATPLSIKANLPRVVWIEEANLLTVPAQNALLKMLEEPPHNTTFYLTCQSATALLPTIRSRTKLTTLSEEHTAEDPEILGELKRVMGLSAGDRLMALGKLDRAEAISYLTSIERSLREKLNTPGLSPAGQQTLGRIGKLATKAHAELNANCSVGLTLQCFYLALPKVKI